MLNQHWRIFQYLNLKTRITRLAHNQNKNPEQLFKEIMSQIGYSTQVHGAVLDDFLKFHHLPFSQPTYLNEVVALLKDICPHYDGQGLHAPYDSSFEKILEYAQNEDAVLAFAHPGFTIQNMTPETMLKNIKNYVERAKGRLIFAENYHQAYPPKNITNEEILKTNEIMLEAKLIPIGGRDMHRNNFKFTE